MTKIDYNANFCYVPTDLQQYYITKFGGQSNMWRKCHYDAKYN